MDSRKRGKVEQRGGARVCSLRAEHLRGGPGAQLPRGCHIAKRRAERLSDVMPCGTRCGLRTRSEPVRSSSRRYAAAWRGQRTLTTGWCSVLTLDGGLGKRSSRGARLKRHRREASPDGVGERGRRADAAEPQSRRQRSRHGLEQVQEGSLKASSELQKEQRGRTGGVVCRSETQVLVPPRGRGRTNSAATRWCVFLSVGAYILMQPTRVRYGDRRRL